MPESKFFYNSPLNRSDEYNQFDILNSFLKRVPVCIAFFSTTGQLIQINRHFQKELGLSNHVLKSFSLERFFGCQTLQYQNLKSQMTNEVEYFSDEVKFLKNDQSEVWFKVSIFLDRNIFDEEGALVMVANDITTTKETLRKSIETESILNSIYENTYEGIYRKDVNKVIQYANNSFLKLYGYDSLKELPEQAFPQLYANQEQGRELDRKLKNSGFLRNEKVLFQRKDGKAFWGLMNANSSITDGIKYYNGAVIDITEEVEKDEMLLSRNTELTIAKEQLDRLLYSASHDLRSPITGLMGLIHLMEIEFSGDEKLKDYFTMIKECADKLGKVIDGINDYTLNTRKRLKSDRIDFDALISKAYEELEAHADFKSIRLVINNQASLPFYSDSERIGVIIKNVMKNSFLFYDKQKPDPFVRIDIHYSADELQVSVRDNGVGIAKAHTEKVFGMFYRAHSELSGAGLGLYIAKETLLKLGGTVEINSTLTQGTVVIIKIPNDVKGKLMSQKLLFKNTGDDFNTDIE